MRSSMIARASAVKLESAGLVEEPAVPTADDFAPELHPAMRATMIADDAVRWRSEDVMGSNTSGL